MLVPTLSASSRRGRKRARRIRLGCRARRTLPAQLAWYAPILERSSDPGKVWEATERHQGRTSCTMWATPPARFGSPLNSTDTGVPRSCARGQ